MSEFKERVFRKRDLERIKNQKEINSLKADLSNIEEKYIQEVRKVQSELNTYRINKNDRVKAKFFQ